ncbi:hypothetical protein [Streptomyces sp. NPDC060275]|uniref:hypothetical protein n=1 Tax=Streptomyces sp. NPDC060275 TaxID=3347090 RepID=UPI003653C4CC
MKRGVIMRSEWHVRPHVERGELVRVPPRVPSPPAVVHALYEEDDDGHVPRRVTEPIEHLAAVLPGRL